MKAEMITRLHVVSFGNNNEYCPTRYRRILPRQEILGNSRVSRTKTQQLELVSPEVVHKTGISVEKTPEVGLTKEMPEPEYNMEVSLEDDPNKVSLGMF